MTDQQYYSNIIAANRPVDLGFWRAPVGVSVPDDELRFLLVPDAVEAAMIAALASDVAQYQRTQSGGDGAIDSALIVTMGGMLPGILLQDHLVGGASQHCPAIEFGTVGVSLYAGPGVRFEAPRVLQESSIALSDKRVLLVDDLIDRGGTMAFLHQYATDSGARAVMSLAVYLKPEAIRLGGADFYFGEIDQDTWLITPRELVETLVKRVPVWRERGASESECRRRLVELIGYPEFIVEQYLSSAYQRR